MGWSRTGAVVVATTALALTLAGPATAGRYVGYSCASPAGPATTEGWTAFQSGSASGVSFIDDSCAANGTLARS